jgi:DNA-binding NarL/FixJ family response regulator
MNEQSNTTVRVSLIEDDAPSREILARWVQTAAGFQLVSEFGTAEEAVSRLPEQAVDVVLTDIKLPRMSGVECVRWLKPRMLQTQFVMLTVYEDSEHIFDALRAGATGYLLKQVTYDELLAALRYVHQGGSPMNSYIARRIVRCFPAVPAQPAETDLSTRELAVLQMMAQGFLFKEIADALQISVHTVDTYCRRIYEKLHVRSRAQAVAHYTKLRSG